MRALPLLALLLAAPLIAGCVEDPAPPADGPCVGEGCTRTCDGCAPAAPGAPDPGAAPNLTVGTAWTYAGSGVYDIEREFTVVVARADAAGYLFAAAEESQLAAAATWGRDWFGERDRSLALDGARLFDFPLADGKTWTAWEGMDVTARAAEVRIPGGSEPGFVVEGTTEARKVRWEYAPSVGFLVSYRTEADGVAYFDLALRSVGRSVTWVWLERGPAAYAGGEDRAVALQVREGWDAVAVVAGGAAGGKARLLPPPGGPPPFAYDADGAEAWVGAILPAAPGPWALAAAGAGDGWGWVQATAVRWIRPG